MAAPIRWVPYQRGEFKRLDAIVRSYTLQLATEGAIKPARDGQWLHKLEMPADTAPRAESPRIQAARRPPS